jgi:hypothetical protein
MDGFTGLLDGPRARQAFLLHLVMDPGWSVWVDDHAPLSVMAMVRGQAWVSAPDIPATRIGPSDIAIVRGPEPYLFADPPDTPPQVIALPRGQCTSPKGESLVDAFRYGVRRWGNSATGGTEVLVGAYEHVSELGRHLVAALPRLAVVPAGWLDSPFVDLLLEPDTTIAAVARRVGYANPFALSTAFKRVRGHSPREHRRQPDTVAAPAGR